MFAIGTPIVWGLAENAYPGAGSLGPVANELEPVVARGARRTAVIVASGALRRSTQRNVLLPEGVEWARRVEPLRRPVGAVAQQAPATQQQRSIPRLLEELQRRTREEGVEYAVVRLRGYRNLYIVRGGTSGIAFPPYGRMSLRRILIHTHPPNASWAPSAPDYAQLRTLRQVSAYLLGTRSGRLIRYRSLGGEENYRDDLMGLFNRLNRPE